MPLEPEMMRRIPLFQLLDDDELAELAAHIDEAHYRANQTIFKTGDPGNNMHVVLDGKVETFILDDDGERLVLDTVEAGDIFGELSLLDNEPRSASAVALVPTRTFIIDRDDLQRLFTKKPAAALDILAILGKRIRQTDILLSRRVARNPNVAIEEKLRFGDRVADAVARFGGSWGFIGLFAVVLLGWIALNTWLLQHPFDAPPYIGLNLILSMLAALQAPIIMMSQNRQDAKDRVRSELDFQVNLKAELEIMQLHERIDNLREEVVQEIARRLPGVSENTGEKAS
jgi:CRP/FNR family cyclic AMP-dependent transcriptional regulator